MNIECIETDILIVGGGTAGCYAAIKLGQEQNLQVLIAEKANIERSGCLAAGVNALNAYISGGHTPQDYVEYARKDGEGIVRDDLLKTIAEGVNEVTHDLEKRGLVILKDEEGNYVTRGWRNVKINGENIKPLLAKGAREQKNVTILNHVNLIDLKTSIHNNEKIVTGAYGFHIHEDKFYDISAKAVIIATGGAAGIYRPNNPGFSRHKMWYSPFNTGAGLAMGIRAGAEMTTLENRFVALRCKDTIAPTGTIAQGVGAKQINSRGEIYETKYGISTPERIYGTVEENRAGHGPCFLKTSGISAEAETDLYKAYLNMAPAQTLRWLERGVGPAAEDVEIEGTEPYIVGGHTASGYWVDTGRATTVKGLFAAGDVVGGAPQKYVTGAMVEGEIAARSAAEYVKNSPEQPEDAPGSADTILQELNQHLNSSNSVFTAEQVEEAMQKIMDEYAGGIHTDYRYNESRLSYAESAIRQLEALLPDLPASDGFDLLHIYELRERLTVCRALIIHLRSRQETRWHIFGENADYPEQSPDWLCYVNTRYDSKTDDFQVYRRPLVKGGNYEHTH